MPRKATTPIPSQEGLKANLTEKAKSRREQLTAKAIIDMHRPATRRNDLLPIQTLIRLPVANLKGMNRKVRRANAKHIAEIRNSIEASGMVLPILVTADRRVIDGESRVQAAIQAGLDEVSAIVIDHLSDSQVWALRLTLNRLQEKGQWDIGELRAEFEELIVLGEDLLLTGFEAAEIDIVLADDGDVPASGLADVLPIADTAVVSRIGDLWQLGSNRLLHGDACNPQS